MQEAGTPQEIYQPHPLLSIRKRAILWLFNRVGIFLC
jgi:hypothetical protein